MSSSQPTINKSPLYQDCDEDSAEVSMEVDQSKVDEVDESNPGCCEIWNYGCCRDEVIRERKKMCSRLVYFVFRVICVITAIFVMCVLMPWLIGNIVMNDSAYDFKTQTTISCWKIPASEFDTNFDCLESYGIGLGVWIMILAFIGIVVFFVLHLYLRFANNGCASSVKVDTKLDLFIIGEQDQRTSFNWMVLFFVIFWISFPPFIGAVGGYRLAMNHYTNCDYWKYDFKNNFEYKCTITKEMLSTAFSRGFCREGVEDYNCLNLLQKQCDHCKGIGWATVAFLVWGFPLYIVMMYGLVRLFVGTWKFSLKKYESWKEDLVEQQRKAITETNYAFSENSCVVGDVVGDFDRSSTSTSNSSPDDSAIDLVTI